jgi:HK97 family phage major capsid protein
MRTLEEILADMQALIDKPDMTADDVVAYLALEQELATVQAAGGGEPAPAPGAEGDGQAADVVPAGAPAATMATRTMASAIRSRHNGYTTVVVPAGRPSNRQRETVNDGFRAYLRTGKENADLTRTNAQSTGTGTSGGYLIPEDSSFATRLVEVIKTFGGVKRNVDEITTNGGNPLPMPTDDDTANSAVITAESTTPASGADLVLGQVELGAYEFTASGTGGNALAVPIALIQDSAIDFEAYIAKRLGTRIGRKMASSAVTGTGTGEPQGLLAGLTGRELGASAGVDYGDLVDLVMSIDEAYWTNGKLYMNRTSFGTVAQIEDGANQLIFKNNSGMVGPSGEPVPALWIAGQLIPVVLESTFDDITLTNGADNIWGAYGDLTEGYIWRNVRQIEVLVNPYTSANKRQIEYNAWARADGRQKNTSAYATIAGWTT